MIVLVPDATARSPDESLTTSSWSTASYYFVGAAATDWYWLFDSAAGKKEKGLSRFGEFENDAGVRFVGDQRLALCELVAHVPGKVDTGFPIRTYAQTKSVSGASSLSISIGMAPSVLRGVVSSIPRRNLAAKLADTSRIGGDNAAFMGARVVDATVCVSSIGFLWRWSPAFTPAPSAIAMLRTRSIVSPGYVDESPTLRNLKE